MNNQIRLTTIIRKDSIENWERVNPILKNGEIALVESGKDRSLIIGDGKTPCIGLTKIHLGEADLYLQSRGDDSMRFVITLENHNIEGKTNDKGERQ